MAAYNIRDDVFGGGKYYFPYFPGKLAKLESMLQICGDISGLLPKKRGRFQV